MAYKYLLSEKELKELTSINKQFDAEKLLVSFRNVEYFYVKKLLSIPLFQLFSNYTNDIPSVFDSTYDTTFADGTITLTPVQAELLTLVKHYFALMVHFDVLGNIGFETSNKGPLEDANSTGLDNIKYKRSDLKTKADELKRDILEFLEDHRVDFPEYFSENNTSRTYNGDKPVSNGSTGIVFSPMPRIVFGV